MTAPTPPPARHGATEPSAADRQLFIDIDCVLRKPDRRISAFDECSQMIADHVAAALTAANTALANERREKEADTARLNHLAAWCYREGGRGYYAPVYVVAHSDVWPIAGRELNAREKEAALRTAIDESIAAQIAAPRQPQP